MKKALLEFDDDLWEEFRKKLFPYGNINEVISQLVAFFVEDFKRVKAKLLDEIRNICKQFQEVEE